MAGSVNKAILVGNLGADPEIRRTNDGRPIVNMRIATSDSWRDKNTGERREKTEWHTVVIFNENLAKLAEQYLKKGAKVYCEGPIRTRKWQDNNGLDRYSTEIVLEAFRGQLELLERAEGSGYRQNQATSPDDYGTQSKGDRRAPDAASPGMRDLDDEIPF